MGRKDDDNDLGSEDEAMALLSPEERAALEDPDEAAALKKIAGESGNDDNDDDGGDDDHDGGAKASGEEGDDNDDEGDDNEGGDDDDDKADLDPAKKAADDQSGADAEADAAAAAAKQADDDAAATQAALDLSPLQAAYKARLDAIAAEKSAAFKKYNDGEITPEEYAAADEKAANDRDAARDDLQSNTAWFREVHAFKGDVIKEINYDKPENAEKFSSFDDWVKRLGSKPENADKPARWFLEEAHKKVKLEYGAADAASAAPQSKTGKAAEPQKTTGKPGKKAPDLTKIPPTVGGLPSAAEEQADGDSGEFAHLDGLSGMALERALAKLSPEQEERYLRG
jgi:hypothetical protein